MNRCLSFLFTLSLIATLAVPGRGQGLSDAVKQALSRGDVFAGKGNFVEAMEAYHQADKLAHHECAECYLHMFKADRDQGDLPSALDDTKRAIKAAGDNKILAAQSHLLRGTLLAEMASKASDKRLRDAEFEDRQLIALDPGQVVAHFNLGQILIRQERDGEGVDELKTYIATPGADPKLAGKARRFIASPVRAREPFIPDFSFTAIAGQTISNVSLRGKVVLFDFWGSWCGPCRESVPILLSLHGKYLSQPVQFVGVSSDKDEQAWKQFIVVHHMDWPQYLDLPGQVIDQFEVEAYPTYIVVDRDGVIRYRQAGVSDTTALELNDAIEKALKRPPQPALAAAAATPPPQIPAAAGTPNPPPATAPPAATAPSVGKADAQLGEVSGSIYTNKSLGLSYQFPSGWIAATQETLQGVNAANEASARARFISEHPDATGPVKVIVTQAILYVSQRGEGNGQIISVPSIRITAGPWRGPDLTPDYVKSNGERTNPPGTTLVRGPEEFKMSGQDFFRTDFELTDNSRHASISRIETIAKGNIVMLDVWAKDKAQLDELVSTLKTISFSAR